MTSSNLNNTYCFAARKHDDQHVIKINKGPLKGAFVKINRVRFGTEEDNDGNIAIDINYTMVQQPKNTKLSEKQISAVLGPIVVDIIKNYGV